MARINSIRDMIRMTESIIPELEGIKKYMEIAILANVDESKKKEFSWLRISDIQGAKSIVSKENSVYAKIKGNEEELETLIDQNITSIRSIVESLQGISDKENVNIEEKYKDIQNIKPLFVKFMENWNIIQNHIGGFVKESWNLEDKFIRLETGIYNYKKFLQNLSEQNKIPDEIRTEFKTCVDTYFSKFLNSSDIFKKHRESEDLFYFFSYCAKILEDVFQKIREQNPKYNDFVTYVKENTYTQFEKDIKTISKKVIDDKYKSYFLGYFNNFYRVQSIDDLIGYINGEGISSSVQPEGNEENVSGSEPDSGINSEKENEVKTFLSLKLNTKSEQLNNRYSQLKLENVKNNTNIFVLEIQTYKYIFSYFKIFIERNEDSYNLDEMRKKLYLIFFQTNAEFKRLNISIQSEASEKKLLNILIQKCNNYLIKKNNNDGNNSENELKKLLSLELNSNNEKLNNRYLEFKNIVAKANYLYVNFNIYKWLLGMFKILIKKEEKKYDLQAIEKDFFGIMETTKNNFDKRNLDVEVESAQRILLQLLLNECKKDLIDKSDDFSPEVYKYFDEERIFTEEDFDD